jgi:hypothetical protein
VTEGQKAAEKLASSKKELTLVSLAPSVTKEQQQQSDKKHAESKRPLPFQLAGGDDQPFDLVNLKQIDANVSLLAHTGLLDDAAQLLKVIVLHQYR